MKHTKALLLFFSLVLAIACTTVQRQEVRTEEPQVVTEEIAEVAPSPSPMPPEQEEPSERFASLQVEEVTTDTMLAFYLQGLNMRTLKDIVVYRRPRAFRFLPPEEVETLPREALNELVKQLVVQELAYYEALQEELLPNSEEMEKFTQANEEMLLSSLVYDRLARQQIKEPTEAELQAYYDQYRDERYVSPLSFNIRHIFLSTYVKHTVQEGETLESIAREVAGDEKAQELILLDETKEPYYVPPEERGEKLYKPVEPGMVLLVPMKPADEQAANERIKGIHEELKAGADFVELSRKYSEAGSPGEVVGPITPAKDEKGVLAEITEAAKNTEVGEFSDIIKTKHGYQIIQVVDKKPERIVPYDNVKRTIELSLSAERREAQLRKVIMELIAAGEVIKAYPENMTEEAESEAPLVKVGEFTYAVKDLKQRMPDLLGDERPASDRLVEVIQRVSEVRTKLLAAEGRRRNLEASNEYHFAYHQRLIAYLGENYIMQKMREVARASEEELAKYYEENPEEYIQPRQYKLRAIVNKIADDFQRLSEDEKQEQTTRVLEELKKVRAEITSVEDFARLAKEVSEDENTAEKGGELGYVTERYRGGFDGRLERMHAGDISEPFPLGPFAYIIMVEDIKEKEILPLEQVKRSVERTVMRQKWQSAYEVLTDGLLEKYEVELLF